MSIFTTLQYFHKTKKLRHITSLTDENQWEMDQRREANTVKESVKPYHYTLKKLIKKKTRVRSLTGKFYPNKIWYFLWKTMEIHYWIQPDSEDIQKNKEVEIINEDNGIDWDEKIVIGRLFAWETGDIRWGNEEEGYTKMS